MSTQTATSLRRRTIHCLLFDLGDTLWTRLNKSIWRNLELVANQHAVAVLYKHLPASEHPAIDSISLGKQLRQAIEKQTKQATRQKPGYEPDFARAACQALHEMGFRTADEELGAQIFEALRIHIADSRHTFEDVFPTLAELRRRGFQLGVVTNRQYGGQPFFHDLKKLGFLEYFAPWHIAVSADLGLRKPNPAIFQHVLNEFKLPPEEVAMVGDSLHADIGGAKHLGMLAIWKPKLRLRAAAEAELLSQYAMLPTPGEISAVTADGLLQPKVPEVNDDYLLAYVHRHEKHGQEHLTPETQPDLIIEHTKDLLEIFERAGKQ